MRKRRMLGHKSSGGVAFENPSYLREVNMDHIHVSWIFKSFLAQHFIVAILYVLNLERNT